MPITQILTHPGGAHKDDFLACCVLIHVHGATVRRAEPEIADLEDPEIAVVDVGHRHEPGKSNFDHHQFPKEHPPLCALSLVLQDLGVYDDARRFCDWLEPAEWFDTRGAMGTAKWLGVNRAVMDQLNSPIDVTLLRRFAQCGEVKQGEALWEVMRWIGEDLMIYLETLKQRLAFIGQHAEFWELDGEGDRIEALFMPRTDPLPNEPSSGLPRYIAGEERTAVGAMVYPDRRGPGYGLSRYEDDPRFDFTRIAHESDVHFAHARGFVAKTSAIDRKRLRELLRLALVD